MSEPVEKQYEGPMNTLAGVIDRVFNKEGERKIGFALLVFKLGETDDGRMNYISNANREDMTTALKELLARFEGRFTESDLKH